MASAERKPGRKPAGNAETVPEIRVPDDAAETAPNVRDAGGRPAAANAEQPKKGVTQLGDFKLQKKLGQGGMGIVYLARQVSLDRPVALKTLSRQLAKRPDAVQRFLREARSMAKLQHPHIVQVYAADSQAGFNYAALEFIDGQSMQDWMNELQRLSVADALHVALIAADALKHAHDQNMVHRDVKPDNILITKTGVVKVSDFGLAKALDEDTSVTQSGTGLGTPLYMAPEQARNAKHVDQRSDIYALGCTLYYFLTGELPFPGSTALEIISAKETGKFKSARRANPEVPERLDLIIDKMLAKNAAHRYENCAALIGDLQALNLAAPALGFIHGAVPAGVAGIPSVVVGGMTTQKLDRRTVANPAATTKRPAGQSADASDRDRPGQWYVSYTSKDGKHHMKQMSTEQVLAALKRGGLGLKSKAKRNAADALMPLAQFPEFVHAVEQLAIRERTSTKESRFQQMFDEVDRYERRKKRWRFLRRITESTLGGVGLLIWLGAAAAVVVALFFLIPWLGGMIADHFNLR